MGGNTEFFRQPKDKDKSLRKHQVTEFGADPKFYFSSHYPGNRGLKKVKPKIIRSQETSESDVTLFNKIFKHSSGEEQITRDENTIYPLFSEFLYGITGAYFLATDFALDEMTFAQVLEIMISAAESLKILHNNSALHGDVKPENFMICPIYNPQQKTIQFQTTIFDFDKTKIYEDKNKKDVCYAGTYCYAAPEALTEADIKNCTDSYQALKEHQKHENLSKEQLENIKKSFDKYKEYDLDTLQKSDIFSLGLSFLFWLGMAQNSDDSNQPSELEMLQEKLLNKEFPENPNNIAEQFLFDFYDDDPERRVEYDEEGEEVVIRPVNKETSTAIFGIIKNMLSYKPDDRNNIDLVIEKLKALYQQHTKKAYQSYHLSRTTKHQKLLFSLCQFIGLATHLDGNDEIYLAEENKFLIYQIADMFQRYSAISPNSHGESSDPNSNALRNLKQAIFRSLNDYFQKNITPIFIPAGKADFNDVIQHDDYLKLADIKALLTSEKLNLNDIKCLCDVLYAVTDNIDDKALKEKIKNIHALHHYISKNLKDHLETLITNDFHPESEVNTHSYSI